MKVSCRGLECYPLLLMLVVGVWTFEGEVGVCMRYFNLIIICFLLSLLF